MKKTLLLLLLIPCIFSFSRAQNFSGSIAMQISGTDMNQPMNVTYYFLNNEVLMKPDLSNTNNEKDTEMGVLFIPAENLFYILMDSSDGQRIAIKKSYENINEMLDSSKYERPKIIYTGETKTILGYKCEKIIAETSTATMDMWVTKDLGFNLGKLMAYSNMGKKKSNADSKYWGDLNGASLETIVYDKANNSTVKIAVTSISTQAPNAAMFSLDGYQVMDMPKMPSFKEMLPFGKKKR